MNWWRFGWAPNKKPTKQTNSVWSFDELLPLPNFFSHSRRLFSVVQQFNRLTLAEASPHQTRENKETKISENRTQLGLLSTKPTLWAHPRTDIYDQMRSESHPPSDSHSDGVDGDEVVFSMRRWIPYLSPLGRSISHIVHCSVNPSMR